MRKADNLPPSCTVVTKSGNLNFLEPSGPFRACNGTALRLRTEVTVKMCLQSTIMILIESKIVYFSGTGPKALLQFFVLLIW